MVDGYVIRVRGQLMPDESHLRHPWIIDGKAVLRIVGRSRHRHARWNRVRAETPPMRQTGRSASNATHAAQHFRRRRRRHEGFGSIDVSHHIGIGSHAKPPLELFFGVVRQWAFDDTCPCTLVKSRDLLAIGACEPRGGWEMVRRHDRSQGPIICIALHINGTWCRGGHNACALSLHVCLLRTSIKKFFLMLVHILSWKDIWFCSPHPALRSSCSSRTRSRDSSPRACRNAARRH